jgi:thioredoxin 1
MVQALDRVSFDHVLATATRPVLVDFYADWCAPCRALAPFIEQFAREYGDRIVFAKVDIAQEPEIAARFHVEAVPTLALFAGGEQIFDLPGFIQPHKLRTFLDSVANTVARATGNG